MMKISIRSLGHQCQNGNVMSGVSSKTIQKALGFCVTVITCMSVLDEINTPSLAGVIANPLQQDYLHTPEICESKVGKAVIP